MPRRCLQEKSGAQGRHSRRRLRRPTAKRGAFTRCCLTLRPSEPWDRPDHWIALHWKIGIAKKCCFCHKDESIRHLCFKCHFARVAWSVIHAASGLFPPQSMSHMFGGSLWGIRMDLKRQVLLGAAATCWSLWLCSNDVVFDKKNNHLLYKNKCS